jgi:hypothetical protein
LDCNELRCGDFNWGTTANRDLRGKFHFKSRIDDHDGIRIDWFIRQEVFSTRVVGFAGSWKRLLRLGEFGGSPSWFEKPKKFHFEPLLSINLEP